jgi:hypothetical protein
MTMLPQPPPDAAAPPPSEAALRSRRQWLWILIAGLLVVLCVFCLRAFNGIRGHDSWERPFKSAQRLGLTLFEFENEFGKPPDATTVAAVREPGTSIPLGTKTSNDFFRQLIAAGFEQNERLFSTPSRGGREADNRVDGTHALEKGECGFSYLIGPRFNFGTPQPIVVTPLITGTDRFDPTLFDGWAIILWTDNSVKKLPIDKHGHVMHLGKHLLDPSNPVWAGRPPVIAWPE